MLQVVLFADLFLLSDFSQGSFDLSIFLTTFTLVIFDQLIDTVFSDTQFTAKSFLLVFQPVHLPMWKGLFVIQAIFADREATKRTVLPLLVGLKSDDFARVAIQRILIFHVGTFSV
jgi:hypothetical protein